MKTRRAAIAIAVIAILPTLSVATRAAAQGRGMGRHRGERSDSAHAQAKEDPAEEMADQRGKFDENVAKSHAESGKGEAQHP